MAKLVVNKSFSAFHGTCNVLDSTFFVHLQISGAIRGGLVAGVDDLSLNKRLVEELEPLAGSRLDDFVGRATLENIATYLFMQLRDTNIDTLSVSADGSSVVVDKHDALCEVWEAELAFRRGVSFLVRADGQKAFDMFSISISFSPSWAVAYNARGRSLRKLGRLEEALEDYKQAISLDSSCGEAYRNLGNVLLELGNVAEALPALDFAVNLLPDSALAYNNRGFGYMLINELERALDDHNKAIALNSVYEEAFRDRALVLKKLNRENEALRDIAKADSLVLKVNEAALERDKLMSYYYPATSSN